MDCLGGLHPCLRSQRKCLGEGESGGGWSLIQACLSLAYLCNAEGEKKKEETKRKADKKESTLKAQTKASTLRCNYLPSPPLLVSLFPTDGFKAISPLAEVSFSFLS